MRWTVSAIPKMVDANPSYFQQNNDFSLKSPFLSILIVIVTCQRFLI